jgi:pimeloyl-ACP methyl ester carboxylesterase
MATQARFVWLHGFGASPASTKAAWARARMAERGVALEVPDLNEPSFSELTISRMLAQLDALWAARPAPLALTGSSLGGYVAALFAEAHPERVAALALLAPAFCLAAEWGGRLGSEKLERWRADGFLEVDHYAFRRKERLAWNFLEDAALHAPFPLPRARTLIIQGTRDETVPPATARHLRSKMEKAGREVRLVERDEGHELTADLPGLWRELEQHFFHESPRPTP